MGEGCETASKSVIRFPLNFFILISSSCVAVSTLINSEVSSYLSNRYLLKVVDSFYFWKEIVGYQVLVSILVTFLIKWKWETLFGISVSQSEKKKIEWSNKFGNFTVVSSWRLPVHLTYYNIWNFVRKQLTYLFNSVFPRA